MLGYVRCVLIYTTGKRISIKIADMYAASLRHTRGGDEADGDDVGIYMETLTFYVADFASCDYAGLPIQEDGEICSIRK